MNAALAELKARIRGRVRLDVPLSRYTTYRIGGPASAMLVPSCGDDVAAALRFCNDTGTRWLALGLGSNVLVDDGGFEGVVIRLGKGMDAVTEDADGEDCWKVGAGFPTPRLARKTAAAGLGGVQRLIGVPGTVGGGVAMNAGAHGQEFRGVVRNLELVDADGDVRVVDGDEVPWSYRDCGLREVIITSALLRFVPGDPKELERDVRHLLDWRKRGTPFDEPCCGSVFRNPGGSRTAGQLIDSLGLKGYRVGGAQVSHKHANYVVNKGSATAGDVRAVIEAVRGRVVEEYGIELELEVRLVGEGVRE